MLVVAQEAAMTATAGQAATDQDWQDLLARSRRDGVYAVISTGIHCRFGCPSRPPLRRNLRLFDSAAAAAAAGYRACKRCGGAG